MGYYPAKICALLNIVILIGKIHFFSLMDVVASHAEYPMRYFNLVHDFLSIPWKYAPTDRRWTDQPRVIHSKIREPLVA